MTGQDGYFHIYNRGNNRQNIFLDEEDYKFFLTRLRQNLCPNEAPKRMRVLPQNSYTLLSYCLISNHFHILLRQNRELSPSALLLRICSSYSKYFNKKYKKVGHVFQDKYKLVNIYDDDQLLWVHAYINLNPFMESKKNNAKKKDYKWSSYNELLGLKKGICDVSFISKTLNGAVGIERFMKNALPVLRINKKLGNLNFE